MRISKQWIHDFVELSDSLAPETIARELTMKTVEVEGIEASGVALNNIVIGKVVSAGKHPNADKLQVCQVDVGEETVQVVCGGSNVREGMKVALGRIGAKVLWHGAGELVELKPATIRGVESAGMICASDEIGLGEQFPKQTEKEIIDLSHLDAAPGTALATALGLGDVVFHIDNKSLSNRPDLWGHYGLAREIAAIFQAPLKNYSVPNIPKGKGIVIQADVKEKILCPRFMAVAVDGVTVQPSPSWLQERLTAAGVRPINNIVDITNYVMLDIGQPLHAYDATMVADHTFVVRRASNGEKFTTLDGKEQQLTDDMLVIADPQKVLGIAGVMGGLDSGITPTCTTVIFEAANFDPLSIRKTSTSLGIRSEASARFEKSLDPTLPEMALKKAMALTLEIVSGARAASPVTDHASFSLKQEPIAVSFEFINKKIGIELQKNTVLDILKRLGFGVKEKKGTLSIAIPSWRATKDISLPEDVVEEIVRMVGYDHVPPALPLFPVAPAPADSLASLERRLRTMLAYECGFTEVYNYSFESEEWLGRLGIGTKDHLRLDNPVAKDRPVVRRSLVPNLLENVEKNIHEYDSLRLFELGVTYIKEENGEPVESGSADRLPKQDIMLGAVYAEKGVDVPFYELAGCVGRLAKRLGVMYELKRNTSRALLHPGRSAVIVVDNTEVGYMGELHPAQQQQIGVDTRMAIMEINLSLLSTFIQEKNTYTPVPLYPSIERDVAFVIEKEVAHADIVKALQQVDSLITSVSLFDVYEGKQIGDGKKSVAYRLVYQSFDRTLETKEVDVIQEKVISVLEKKFQAMIRK